MLPIYESDYHSDDGFDRIPDALILVIFNQLSDIKTLTRCRAVSKRFNSLVPQAESLLVKVDCVISSETGEWFLLHLIKSILQSFQDLISPRKQILSKIQSSPADILRGFEKIRNLEIELPAGDLRLEKGTVLRWKAVFGRTLKSCVILAVRSIEEEQVKGNDQNLDDEEDDDEIDFHGDGSGGLKLRVVWTISALIAASSRHYLLREVIKEHKGIERLVLRDREGEGTVVMDGGGLREFREGEVEEGGGGGGGGGEADVSTVGWKNRTTVPAVRMRMRHEARLDLSGGVRMKGATLVVVRPTEVEKESSGAIMKTEVEERKEDKGFALGAFDGVFGEAVEALLKRRSYLLEMNSF